MPRLWTETHNKTFFQGFGRTSEKNEEKKKNCSAKKLILPEEFWREKIDGLDGSCCALRPWSEKACGYGGGTQIPWNFMVNLKTTVLLDILFKVPKLVHPEDNQVCQEVLGEGWNDYFQISCFTKCYRRLI